MPQFKHAIVVTGSIGSGKSAVCEILRERGFEIIDADSIAHEQLNLCASEVAAEFGDEVLSGGEAQRLAFARVYFAKPAFLLLDEATSALDNALAKELLTALKHDFPNLGVLAITHQEELKFIFDKVVDTGSSE
nr:dephospho-CoA kinase [uncultured Campylobacter sp.]